MAYCIKISEFNPITQKIVSGPWSEKCQECDFLSSSSSEAASSSSSEAASSSSSEAASSSSSEGPPSLFFACVSSNLNQKISCINYSEYDSQNQNLIEGPFFGEEGCATCFISSSSSYKSSISSSSSSSISISSSSSNEGCPCKMPQCACCCIDTEMYSKEGPKITGLPKYLDIGIKEQALCWLNSLDDANTPQGEKCYTNPGADSDENIELCFSGISGFLEENGCNSVVSNISPSFSISPSRLQIWDSDGCDENGIPINPRFLNQNITLTLSGCDSKTFSGSMTFSEWGLSADFGEPIEFKTCTGYLMSAPAIYTGPSSFAYGWQARYRREYEDWTFNENIQIQIDFSEKNGDDYFVGVNFSATAQINSDPTCREPESSKFCGCIDEDQYNSVNLEDLNKYDSSPEECDGRPIDIDVVCGESGPDLEGNNTIEGGVTMYYYPFPNTVPVINNKAYDTTNLPDPPEGKINVIKIYSASSRNEIRQWVCSNLKFATIVDQSKWPENPDEALEFNWPFNDLYFSKGCLGGDNVNLVPC